MHLLIELFEGVFYVGDAMSWVPAYIEMKYFI